MRIIPLSSFLPLCNGVVVLDERLPVKGDGLGLSSRLLVDGCEGGGVGGGIVQRMSSHQSIRQRVQLSELKAMEREQMGRGRGGGSVRAFVVLINVKGKAGHTHKVNGESGDRVCKTDRARVSICLAE